MSVKVIMIVNVFVIIELVFICVGVFLVLNWMWIILYVKVIENFFFRDVWEISDYVLSVY